MGGKSKSQTTGYKYYLGLLMGLCHGPIDALLAIRAGDREAWKGEQDTSGAIAVNAPKLFGGDEKEGGVVGMLDVQMGEPTQLENDYLISKLGSGRTAYRGIVSLVFRAALAAERSLFGSDPKVLSGMLAGGGGHITSNNPYIKPWAFRVRRILQGWKGGTAWYAAKAPIEMGCNDGPASGALSLLHFDASDGSTIFYDEVTASNWTISDPTTTATISNAQSKFGGTSLEFDWAVWTGRNSGNIPQIYTNAIAPFNFDGVAVKFWMRRTSTGGDAHQVVDIRYTTPLGAVSTVFSISLYKLANQILLQTEGVSVSTNASSLAANVWQLFEFSVVGGFAYIFVDGVLLASAAIGTAIDKNAYATAEVRIRPVSNHTWSVSGLTWIDDFCITYDDVHTASYTVPAAPFVVGGSSTCFKSMNPAHIVYECLTNSEWGMGYDVSIIDTASFTAAADVFFAEGLGLCMQWLRQDSIENFIKLVMDHAGAVTVEDRTTGLIQLKPLRGGYTIGSLPQFGSELGNVIELRRFERAAVTDNINEVSVSYTDAQTGKTGSVSVQNLAGVQAAGRVISQSVDYPGIPTMDLALRKAMELLRAYTSGLARVNLVLNRAGYALTPGDVFAFSWLPDGISLMPLRVIDIDYGSLVDGQVQVECLEDVFGLPATTYVAQQTTGWVEPDSTAQPPAATAVFEAPYRELLAAIGRSETKALSVEAGYVYAAAARAPGFNLCYELYTKIGADPYADTGTGDWCPSGTLVAAISASATSISLAAFEDLELIAVGSLAMLGAGATAEMVRVVTVNADTGVLTIARGCLDTTPSPWSLGTRFWAIDDASAGSTTEYATTEVVDAKILTRTSTDLLPLDSVSPTTVTMNQRQIRPYPPGLLRIKDDLNTVTGLAYPVELAGALTASWAHRDRLLQDDQIIDETAASIGPEAGTTYTVRYYQPANTLVNTESGVSGTAATPYTFPADGPARITVEAVRSGYTSWQTAQHTFDYYRYPRIVTTASDSRKTVAGDARRVK